MRPHILAALIASSALAPACTGDLAINTAVFEDCIDCRETPPPARPAIGHPTSAIDGVIDGVVEPVVETPCPDGGALHYDVREVDLWGTLTVLNEDGERLDSPYAAQIVAVDSVNQNLHRSSVRVGADYGMTLLAGIYDLRVDFVDPECGESPCLSLPIAQGVLIDRYQQLDPMLSVRRVSGVLTLDGQTVPDRTEHQGRGHLWFHDPETNMGHKLALSDTGPADFDTLLPVDRRFDVYWIVPQSSAQQLGEPLEALPVGAGLVGQIEPSNGAREHRFDAQSIAVDLDFVLDGQSLPDDQILDDNPRATVQLNPLKGPDTPIQFSLGETGSANVEIRLFPGTYTMRTSTGGSGSQDVFRPTYTSKGCGRLDAPCQWDADTHMAIDLAHLRNVAAGTDVARGSIRFVDADGQPVEFGAYCSIWVGLVEVETGDHVGFTPLGETKSFEIPMYRSRFAVWLQAHDQVFERCPVGYARVSEPFDIADLAAPLELEVKLTSLSGEVLVNGAQMSDDGLRDGDPRGFIHLVSMDDPRPRIARPISLEEQGPARFQALVLPGHYDIRLSTVLEQSRAPLRAISQDVLPATVRSLGQVELSGDAVERTFDVSVVPVDATIFVEDGIAEPRNPNGGLVGMLFREVSEGHTTWLRLDEGQSALDLKLYEGLYTASFGVESGFGSGPEGLVTSGILDTSTLDATPCD